MKKPIFKKTVFDNIPASCWFCEGKAYGTLNYTDGSEIYCCSDCVRKNGKFRGHVMYVGGRRVSLKKPKKPLVNNSHFQSNISTKGELSQIETGEASNSELGGQSQ